MGTSCWRFEEFRLDAANARLTRGDAALPLRPKTFAVLCCLVERAGQLVTKDELLDAVWQRRFISESALEGCVKELRKALGDDARAPRFIETVAKRGYRFVAAVLRAEDTETNAAKTNGLNPWPERLGAAGVGRAEVLARLHGLWEAACGGERRLVWLTGEAGIGKTTLVEMLLQALGADERCPLLLWGQCIEQYGQGEAFLPLLQGLSQMGPEWQPLLQAQAPTWLLQLPGLCPAEERAALQAEVFGATRERMLREGCELLEAISARTPLILVLEDLHWSDPATLELLALLGRRRGRAALMVLGTCRLAEALPPDHPLPRVQHELTVHRLSVEVRIDALPYADVQTYLAQRFPDGALPDAITQILYRRSGGHPLFLVNLVDYLLAQGRLQQTEGWWSVAGGVDDLECGIPDDVRHLIEQRVLRLTEPEQRLLEVASAAGMEASAALLAAALDWEVLATEECCEGLARSGSLLEARGAIEWPDGTLAGAYGFRHALYPEVLIERLSPARRVALHRRLGARLEAAYGPRSDAIAAELARHFEAGRDYPKAVEYLIMAARQAGTRFANREAIGYLDRAEALVERLPESHRTAQRLSILELRALMHRALSEWPDVARILESLGTLAEELGLGTLAATAKLALSFILMLSDRPRCAPAMTAAVETARQTGDAVITTYAEAQSAWFGLEFSNWNQNDLGPIHAAVALARSLGDSDSLAFFLQMESRVRLLTTDYAGSFSAGHESGLLGQQRGDVFHYLAGHFFSSWPLIYRGDWGKALRANALVHREGEKNSIYAGFSLSNLMLGVLHTEAMEFELARQFLLRAAPRQFDHFARLIQRVWLAHASLGLAHLEDAAAILGELDTWQAAGTPMELTNRMVLALGWSEYWLARAEPERSGVAGCQLLDLAGPPGDQHHLALAHRTLARCALAEGDGDRAASHITAALAALEPGPLPLAAWRVHATAGEVCRHQGRRREAGYHDEQAAAVLQSLAASIGDDPDTMPLRRGLLGASPIRAARDSSA